MSTIRINSHSIYYRQINSGVKPTFLFINSLGTNFHIWDQVVYQLQKDAEIILFDQRGHGMSDFVGNTHGLSDFVDDTEVLVNSLDIHNLIVVGLSMGGMIAQRLALRMPERIGHLVLCDTCYKIGTVDKWNERIQAIRRRGLAALSGEIVRIWFSENFRSSCPEQVAEYENMLSATSEQGYIIACEAIREANLINTASQIKVPTLCLVGSEDEATSINEVRSLADLIKESRFEVIPGSGHLPCVDNPKLFVELINHFIE